MGPPHLVAVALSGLAIWALYRLLRLAFSRNAALLGCVLLAVNPLFIHYAPFVMTDIPVMLFVSAAAVAYLRARQTGRWLFHGLAAAALAAAMLAKYSAIFFAGGLGLFEVLRLLFPARGEEGPGPGFRRRAWRLVMDMRPWFILVGAAVLFYLVHAAAYARAIPGQTNTFNGIVGAFQTQADIAPFATSDPTYELVSELSTAFSLPLALAALVGMVVATLRRTEADLFCLAWFGVVLALLTFIVHHKEARYAFPVVPPLIYFIVRGLGELWHSLARPRRREVGEPRRSHRMWVASLALLLLGVRPMALAARELGRFYDPVYSQPFLPEVAGWVFAHTEPGQRVLLSRGFAYNIYAANPFFSPYEEFMHFHGIGRCALTYFLDRPLEETNPVPPVEGLEPFVERFATSEVVLTGTKALHGPSPEPPEPLTLTFVGRRTLRRVDGGTPDGATYQAVNDPEHRLVLAHKAGGWEVGEGWPGVDWRLYQRKAEGGAAEPFGVAASEPPAVLELVKVEQTQKTFR